MLDAWLGAMFGALNTVLAVFPALFLAGRSTTFGESGERWDDTDLFKFVTVR